MQLELLIAIVVVCVRRGVVDESHQGLKPVLLDEFLLGDSMAGASVPITGLQESKRTDLMPENTF